MKEKSSSQKTSQHGSSDSQQAPSAGPEGAVIAPPAYEMDVLDQPGSFAAIQRKTAPAAGDGTPGGRPVNRTGLPDGLKSGVEHLSGLSLEDVRVHYNSPKPAGLQALAYTQGTQIHVAPGQERHVPHEAWHVIQQKQGRVKATFQAKGVSINDDPGLEHDADVMGQKTIRMRYPDPFAKVAQRKHNPLGVVQRVKQPPTGNFVRYVNGNLTNTGITAGLHPDQAEVASEARFTANSAPVNSLGWANLNPNTYTLNGGVGGGVNTQVYVWPRIGQNGNNYTRMHLIHHRLAANANNNINNIVLGTPEFNAFHKNHVELFMGDSMNTNFYTSTGNQSLNAMLLAGENLGVAGPAHANAGAPYVVGAAPTFPASLLTGVTLANNNGVPANAQEITTDEDTLDQHVVIWYEVVPVFGLNGLNLYNSMVLMLNNHYLNNRVGAVQTGEGVPAGILGAGNMLRNMADALAGIYVTDLAVKGSFFTPDPASIPAVGVTADNIPWKDSRIPPRTLNNPSGRPYWRYDMLYDAGMGVLTAPTPAPFLIAQL